MPALGWDMELVTVSMVRWNTRCLNNGHESVTYGPAGGMGGYGSWLGRTPAGEICEIDLFSDPLFEDVNSIVKLLRASDATVDEATRDVLGFACDPSPAGQNYTFRYTVCCPICGSEEVRYGPDDPAVVEFRRVPRVTHSKWDSIDPEQRVELVKRTLVDRDWITE